MAYTWHTQWPGVVAQHGDHCAVNEGGECSCGPVGYRASIEDPESGDPVLSPILDTSGDARAWRHEQREAFEAWAASNEQRPTLDAVAEDFLAAAARGSARDRFGRRFDTEGLRAVRWALNGHVREELGAMPIAEIRTRHVQSLVDRLDAAGLTQRRVDAVVHGLRSLFAYARERELVDNSPADSIALPDDDQPRLARIAPPAAGASPAPAPQPVAPAAGAPSGLTLDPTGVWPQPPGWHQAQAPPAWQPQSAPASQPQAPPAWQPQAPPAWQPQAPPVEQPQAPPGWQHTAAGWQQAQTNVQQVPTSWVPTPTGWQPAPGGWSSAPTQIQAQAPAPATPPGMIPEEVIWMSLKAVTLVFILIALILVAESV